MVRVSASMRHYAATNSFLWHFPSRLVIAFCMGSPVLTRYVVVRNVPALGVIDDLLKRLSLYGKICEHRILDHNDDLRNDDDDDTNAAAYSESRRDDDRFTDVVWVQYETVNNARHAKVRAVQKPFFGSILHIQYAPLYETREDTMVKLQQRRELLQCHARVPVGAHYSRPRNQQYYVPDTQET